MSSDFTINIDPSTVLGVARDASLEDIRDAYRAKAKRYHPDTGGEDWAFRILSQSYEILCTARITRARDREAAAPPRQPRPAADRPSWMPPPTADAPPPRLKPTPAPQEWSTETLRPGVQDRTDDPTRVVDVERLSVRHQADHVWLLTEQSSDQHFLSCSLNLIWPTPDLSTPPASIEGAEEILQGLGAVVEELTAQSRALSSRTSVEEGRFSGWVTYPNVERASAALARLRDLLHARGLAIHQWSRDMIIPRQGR